jgi:hypothetical protein
MRLMAAPDSETIQFVIVKLCYIRDPVSVASIGETDARLGKSWMPISLPTSNFTPKLSLARAKLRTSMLEPSQLLCVFVCFFLER